MVRDPQHAQIDLLGELRRIRMPAHAPIQESLQGTPVFGEQPLH